ncbi:Male sterility, NAD-binding protein [Niveomyces insectorum RCEF 264]|uniref:Male sterility, NAD-binding protein n=1 Tax=Niveomyces insectorum RCEF 264 TaxID=1081102 RepID=A0A167UQW1_9HYPO|nr:Male sterility, NAD-binding protein [Niveomyces insectorum RCEF 264]
MARAHGKAGTRLLPNIVDDVATEEPDRILYEYPSSSDLRGPWTKISARQYANSVNRAARWIEDTLGGRGQGFPRLGYSGPPDLRYYILVVAAVKAGYVMLYNSLRNSAEGDAAVIEAAGCKTWLVPSRGSHIHRVVELGRVALELVDLPDLDFFVDATPVPHYPYTKTWEEARRDPVWVLHTSGSTGHPKPVVRYLDSIAFAEANTLLRPVDGRPLLLHDIWGTRVFSGFPCFHAAGLNNGTLWPLVHGGTIIFGPALAMVTADVVVEVLQTARPAAMYVPPSLLEDIAKDDKSLALLDSLDAVGYAGGPLNHDTGVRITQHTVLRQGIGTTETGWLPAVETDPEDWHYTHVHPDTGNQFQDRGNNLYELVAVRSPALEKWQPIFSTFPELDTYPFRDLFSPHPTKPGLYKYEGRIDNIIVLSNGEKVQPQETELIIATHPLVSDAIVVGQGRFQVALLLQPEEKALDAVQKDEVAYIDRIWPFVEKANALAPAHAQIHREFVVVGTPSKPFVKTGKGTVRRGPTVELYKNELDAVYAQTDAETGARAGYGAHGLLPAIDFSSAESLRRTLLNVLLSLSEAQSIGDQDDLFTVLGLDSLLVLALQRHIVRGLPRLPDGRPAINVPASVIYRNPTLAQLHHSLWAAYEAQASGQGSRSDAESRGADTEHDSTAASLLQRYPRDMPHLDDGPKPSGAAAVDCKGPRSETGYVVVLTGSTGGLGSYVLNELAQSTAVREIWCLNRAADGGASRQHELQAQRGAPPEFASKKNIHFHHATLARPRLGLPTDIYAYLRDNVTHVVHTQWQVDFNLSVASFEPHIQGVRNLIDLCAAAPIHNKRSRPRLIFTSSVGVANKFDTAGGAATVPEASITDLSVAGQGYGESKLVAELLLTAAAEKCGIPVTICRVGQISGPLKKANKKGIWNEKEWFPSIIRFSAHAKIVPASLGRNEVVDWIPVDYLAEILLELAEITGAKPASESPKVGDRPTIVHAVHPRPVRWSDALLPTVRARFASKLGRVDVVSLQTWVATLTKAATDGTGDKDEATLFALRLVQFLSHLSDEGKARPLFSTAESEKRSTTLRNLALTGADAMQTWLEQWGL